MRQSRAIAETRRLGAARKADRLAAWLDTLLHVYTVRTLRTDRAAARGQADTRSASSPTESA